MWTCVLPGIAAVGTSALVLAIGGPGFAAWGLALGGVAAGVVAWRLGLRLAQDERRRGRQEEELRAANAKLGEALAALHEASAGPTRPEIAATAADPSSAPAANRGVPAADRSESAAPPGSGSAMPGAVTLLIAEDEHSILLLMKLVLEHEGYRVIGAADGEAALALSETMQGGPDLLIADVQLPRLSGPDLVRTLQNRRPGLKVLLMSGQVSIPSDLAGETVGFLCKPFSPAQLLGRVRELVGPADGAILP